MNTTCHFDGLLQGRACSSLRRETHLLLDGRWFCWRWKCFVLYLSSSFDCILLFGFGFADSNWPYSFRSVHRRLRCQTIGPCFCYWKGLLGDLEVARVKKKVFQRSMHQWNLFAEVAHHHCALRLRRYIGPKERQYQLLPPLLECCWQAKSYTWSVYRRKVLPRQLN